jgi:ribosome maturation factor RimP
MVEAVDESVVELARRAVDEVDAADVELLEARWAGAGVSRCLRLIVDCPDGVNADVCASVSRRFDVSWESERGLRRDFAIDVSSPGPDRQLVTERDFARVAGRWIDLEYVEGDESTQMTAEVALCRDEALTLTGFDEPVEVPLAAIQRARIVFAIGKPTPKRTVRRNKH